MSARLFSPPGSTPTRRRSFRARARWRACWRPSVPRGSAGWTAPCCTRPHDRQPDRRGGGEAPVTPTRVRTLVLVALICAVGMWFLLRQVYTSLPLLPWSGVPALALLAIAEAITGRNVRARLHGRGTPIPPIAVARMAALAKASSLAAAFIGGFAAGVLVYVAGSLDKAAYRSDAYSAAGTLGSAIVLVAAALYLQYGCRVPTSGDRPGHPSAPDAPM